MIKYFTVVGHRDIPQDRYNLLKAMSKGLSLAGYVGRSGSSDGADKAGELGAYGHPFESYLPWSGFNGYYEDDRHIITPELENYQDARLIAASIHPAWDNCSEGVRKMHTRNVYQVLGKTLDTPSDLMICYAKPTKTGVAGGTNTAYQLALRWGVPIINIY